VGRIRYFTVLYVSLLLCTLTGCQLTGIGEAADMSPLPSPSLITVTIGPDPVVISVISVTSGLTATLVSTATLTEPVAPIEPAIIPFPTPTPFFCPYLHGHTEEGTFPSAAMHEDVRYLVHLPPCYDYYVDRAFPVLYLLHGWPLDERHWDALGVDELADDWVSRQVVGPFIIVMPGVGKDGLYVNSSGGSASFEGMMIDELVPLIDTAYSTWADPSGRAVGGISRGGVWALEIALRHQDVFSIVGAHSPALALNRPLPQYDPFLLATQDVTSLRFYLDAGDKDWSRTTTMQFDELLKNQGVDVIYQTHEGGHTDALWSSAMSDYIDYYTLTWPRTFDELQEHLDGAE